MSDRAQELREERDLAAWNAERRFIAELLAWVIARAPRCTVGSCRRIAFWRWKQKPTSGFPREELQCDEHRHDGAVLIQGSEVVRRAMRSAGFVIRESRKTTAAR